MTPDSRATNITIDELAEVVKQLIPPIPFTESDFASATIGRPADILNPNGYTVTLAFKPVKAKEDPEVCVGWQLLTPVTFV